MSPRHTNPDAKILPSALFSSLLTTPRTPSSTLFPYTTLFRSSAIDPLWAILSDPARRGGGWGLEEFFRTGEAEDRKSTRLNSSQQIISYAVFCLTKKKI